MFSLFLKTHDHKIINVMLAALYLCYSFIKVLFHIHRHTCFRFRGGRFLSYHFLIFKASRINFSSPSCEIGRNLCHLTELTFVLFFVRFLSRQKDFFRLIVRVKIFSSLRVAVILAFLFVFNGYDSIQRGEIFYA